MEMKLQQLNITYYGAACFMFQDGSHTILTDPGDFFTKRLSVKKARTLPSPDLILLTHADFDHCNRLKYIQEVRDVPIIATESIKKKFTEYDIDISSNFQTPFCNIEKVEIFHGLRNYIDHTGYIIDFAGKRIFFAGDGVRFKASIPQNIDYMFVTLCGPDANPRNAIKNIDAVKPRCVIAMHWELFFRTKKRALELKKLVTKKYERIECIIPAYYEQVEI